MNDTDFLNSLFAELFAVKSKDGSQIQFRLKPNQRLYRYYTGPKGELFCYTPHPDTQGHCWVWTYMPVGKGSRSGKARRWRMIGLERVGNPRIAKHAALFMLREARGQHGTE